MRVGIVSFLGTNCDRDCLFACDVLSIPAEIVPYTCTDLKGFDVIVLPGGFSYGDYLRCGALAKFSSIMGALKEFVAKGGYVIGICNGFQILTEAGFLPGVLLMNRTLRFIHRFVYVKVEDSSCFFTRHISGSVLSLPIAHKEGSYYCDPDTLQMIESEGLVVMRYSDARGNVTEGSNPNGSVGNIAGVCNKSGNVFGLMPHPERVVGDLGKDGELLWSSMG